MFVSESSRFVRGEGGGWRGRNASQSRTRSPNDKKTETNKSAYMGIQMAGSFAVHSEART